MSAEVLNEFFSENFSENSKNLTNNISIDKISKNCRNLQEKEKISAFKWLKPQCFNQNISVYCDFSSKETKGYHLLNVTELENFEEFVENFKSSQNKADLEFFFQEFK